MKLLASFVATAALALGALVAVPATANAAYPGTVATSPAYIAPGSVKKNKTYKVGYRVKAVGNARPSGTVTFRVFKVGKGGKLSLVRAFINGYTGPDGRFKSLGKFKQGRYATQMIFRPNPGSVYKTSSTGLRYFKVTNRR